MKVEHITYCGKVFIRDSEDIYLEKTILTSPINGRKK